MSFFDTTPQGRILNRFGKDVDVMDESMPTTLRGWLNNLMTIASSLIIIAYTTPLFLIPVAVILAFYYLIQR
jgi:ATP-binding cassette subfamily C (CFTR/MRP) protein 1